MGDFLGTGRVSFNLIQYKSFEKARIFARSLKLKSGSEWRNFYKKKKLPIDIPAQPGNTYKKKRLERMGRFFRFRI